MPLISLKTNCKLSEPIRNELLALLSKTIAKDIGKPEQYVMALIDDISIIMSGTDAPAAFIEVKSIGGLSPKVNHQISADVCGLVSKALAVPANRIYLNFVDVEPTHWGWNAATFG